MNKSKWKVIGSIGMVLAIIAGLITLFIHHNN